MNTTPITILPMTEDDLDFGFSLTDREGWGHRPKDFRRLVLFEPDGCFVAYENNEPVGMICSISFGEHAFLSSLIVSEKARGRGIGSSLMHHAVKYLQGKGVRQIELDGVFPALSLYRRLGFTDKHISLRFMREPSPGLHSEYSPPTVSLDKILAYDCERTAIDRSRALSTYFHDSENALFVAAEKGDSDTKGYALVRPRKGDQYAIGPVLADSDAASRQLLNSILGSFGEHPLSIGVPGNNLPMIRLLLQHGFIFRQPSLRMYRGDMRRLEDSIYAIFSPEKG